MRSSTPCQRRVGAMARVAAAFGAQALLLGPESCDPYRRRALLGDEIEEDASQNARQLQRWRDKKRWQRKKKWQNVGTDEFLVVQSDSEFGFIPEDGLCYDSRQLGCGNAGIEALPDGVEVLATGCELTCSATETAALQ